MKWLPIETHPLDDRECILAQLDSKGRLYIADRGWWIPGEIHEDWDEVEDGIQVKLWEEQEEGRFVTNHCLEFEPTHWKPIDD